MYLERLDTPVVDTKYYVRIGNQNDMPNCTKYCHDRAQEVCENPNLSLFRGRGPGGFPNAENWLEESALPTGSEPKLGSVACFSSDGGSMHVIFIERINEDGSFLISDSRSDPDKSLRNERFWRLVNNVHLKVGQQPGGIGGVGTLLGFQYLPVNDLRVPRDPDRLQLEVFKKQLRCRSSYGLNSPIVNEGCYVPVGIYNVLDTKEYDGYTWCKLEEDHWVACDPSWAKLHGKGQKDDFDEMLDKFVKAMKDEHNTSIAIKQGLSDVSVIIERLLKL